MKNVDKLKQHRVTLFDKRISYKQIAKDNEAEFCSINLQIKEYESKLEQLNKRATALIKSDTANSNNLALVEDKIEKVSEEIRQGIIHQKKIELKNTLLKLKKMSK